MVCYCCGADYIGVDCSVDRRLPPVITGSRSSPRCDPNKGRRRGWGRGRGRGWGRGRKQCDPGRGNQGRGRGWGRGRGNCEPPRDRCSSFSIYLTQFAFVDTFTCRFVSIVHF